MIGDEAVKALQDLHRLKGEGVITDAEFEQSKQRILFEPGPTTGKPSRASDVRAPTDHLGWITLPLKRYAEFSGRSSRREFWMFQLVYVALAIVGVVFVGGTMDEYGDTSAIGRITLGLILIALVGLFVPLLAVEVRRFHDQDRSGWLVLMNLIPYVGALIVLVMMAMPGTSGANRFGPDLT